MTVSKSYEDAFTHPLRVAAMEEEMWALKSRGIWELTWLPNGKVVGCKWVFMDWNEL